MQISNGDSRLTSSISDDELEEMLIIDGLSKEDVKQLCLALYSLYLDIMKPVCH